MSRLWFIKEDDVVISVFPSQRSARGELNALEREEYSNYELYHIDIDDLEEYPDELDKAEEEGYV